MRILGIDPGTASLGYGVIDVSKTDEDATARDFGVFRTTKETSDADRLLILARELRQLIIRTKPDCVVIESLFFFKNHKTAVKVAQAQGVAMLAAAEANLEVTMFTPLQVKLSLTGYGRADKKRLAELVKILLKLPSPPRPDDAADALALALTYARLNL